MLRGQICKIVYKERLKDIIGNLKFFKGHSKESTNEKQSFKIFNKQKSIKFTAHNSFCFVKTKRPRNSMAALWLACCTATLAAWVWSLARFLSVCVYNIYVYIHIKQTIRSRQNLVYKDI